MEYLLIVFVIFLAFAPLTHFVPSKAQRNQARLREAAAVAGMFVEFRDLPRLPGTLERPSAANSIYYGRRLRPSRGRQRRQSLRWAKGQDGAWRALDGRRDAVPECIEALPDEVLAASVDEASCGVYWREAGDVSTVAQISKSLKIWVSALED